MFLSCSRQECQYRGIGTLLPHMKIPRATYGKYAHKGSARVLFLIVRHFPIAVVAAVSFFTVGHADILQCRPSWIHLTPVLTLKRAQRNNSTGACLELLIVAAATSTSVLQIKRNLVSPQVSAGREPSQGR